MNEVRGMNVWVFRLRGEWTRILYSLHVVISVAHDWEDEKQELTTFLFSGF